MTNAEIIFEASQRLAEEGLIGYTGRVFKAVDGEGKEVEYKETEPIHTFAHWQHLGYKVRKGQHAVAKLVIWKYKASKDEEEGIVTIERGGDMFRKTAHFFALSQVEKQEGRA